MSDLQDIALAKLEPHPHNVRRELHDLDDLAASIKAKGIVQALTVVPHPTAKTKYMVLGGHRRLAAAKLAKMKTAPCMIREDLRTAEAQTEFMVVENTQRNDLTPMEEARAYQSLLELPGYNAKLIAENTGRKPRLVQDRIKLSKVSDPIAEKLDSGQITLEQALIFAEFTDDEAGTKKLLNAAGTYDWEYQVRRLREARKHEATAQRTRKMLTGLGVSPLPRPDGWPWRGEYAPAPLEDEQLTPEQHVKAGHRAILGQHGTAEWAVLRADLPDTTAPRELTAEEVAEAEEHERIKAGLEVVNHVRRQFLEDLFASSPTSLAKQILTPKTAEYFIQRKGARSLIGLTEDSKPVEVGAALQQYSLEQLIVAQALVPLLDSEELLLPDRWGPGEYGYDYTAQARRTLHEVLGYQWSDIEKEAMERLRLKKEKHDARMAELRRAREEANTAAPAAAEQGDNEYSDDDD
ncbi:ParB/RepB/Spo0J family partition protein [Arthrobacter agilis]|uniref:ParB/RepB/Spo0J family partition protein n=1 Tax=Arthrobacter agilis TaxID=37921 RepID=UPI002366B963|nr:ParB/RepB/Spo0J family partition protein [Arthrobacter agilis]WDF32222.1 ParB/RepB/Spo0J family partition protein [Arthrobacter agilis]